MKYIQSLILLIALIFSNDSYSQEWHLERHKLQLSNITSEQFFNDLKFYAIEGSRTNGHSIVFDTESMTFAFSYSSMGGDKASLIIEKDDQRMTILFDNWGLEKAKSSRDDIGKGEFSNGFFCMDGNKLNGLDNNGKTVSDWSKYHRIPIISMHAQSKVDLEFKSYLRSTLKYTIDSAVTMDTSAIYRINYFAHHSFNSPYDMKDSCYFDLSKVFCTKNIQAPDSSQFFKPNFKLYIEPEAFSHRSTQLISDPEIKLNFSLFKNVKRLNRIENLGVSIQADHSSVLSILDGKFVILSEKALITKIAAGPTLGTDYTYYLERVD